MVSSYNENFKGYFINKRRIDDSIVTEIWEDDPNEKNPDNQWKLIQTIKEEKKKENE